MEERIFAIPLVAGGSQMLTTYRTLLEQTPGTFRLPIQHQYEQFSASDVFFFGDDKRSFMVSPDKVPLTLCSDAPLEADSPFLEDYLNSDSPGVGVYDVFVQNYSSGINSPFVSASVEQSISAAKTLSQSNTLSTNSQDLIANTSVSEFFPPMRDVYRFDSFYHPLVGELIKKVNGEGTAAALSRDTQSTSEKFFIAAYQPTGDVAEDYPIRHFSFSDLDANGFYNDEFFFHVPLLIAVRLSKNQQFADAQRWFHTIFDPTSRTGDNGAQRFWQFKPFFDMYDNTSGHPFDSIYDMLTALAADPDTADSATLELQNQTLQQIAVWRANPFDPHAIAALRPVAYMKTVVMEYLNNLIAWGDYLYEQFTHESITEATIYYILAYQILGDRPVALPELKVVAKSYSQSDSGVFQLDFRDERYLPFEGAGVISEWKLQLNNPLLAQFDYNTISDVILHINYTARDGGEVFRGSIESTLLELINDYFGTGTEHALQQLISIKQNQSDDWARLSNLTGVDAYQLAVDLGLDNFPYYLRSRGIEVTNIKLALSGSSDVAGWEAAALPEIADAAGNQPYEVAFAEDSVLGLPSAEFKVDMTIDAENKYVQVTLPNGLISAIDTEVEDIFVICSYKIRKLAK